MRFYLLFRLSIMLLAVSSCNRVKQKGRQVASHAKTMLSEKKENLGDKIITRFDAYQSDTRFNRKRFTEFFGFTPGLDVTELYCHADQMGIDHDYQFAFSCKPATIQKIVTRLNLEKTNSPDNFSRGIWHSFPWWDSTKISKINPYKRRDEHESYEYLWHDSLSSKAYYFIFDM